ncbi:MAG: hypothetical protein EOO88_63325 [Pedobacter sp.]|nr:MAG: hypothetical protein EOO88_63325 [Pedobacter sp.]
MVADKDTSLARAFTECLKQAVNPQGMTLRSHKARYFGKSARRTSFLISPEVVKQSPGIVSAFGFYPESTANLNFDDWVIDLGEE